MVIPDSNLELLLSDDVFLGPVRVVFSVERGKSAPENDTRAAMGEEGVNDNMRDPDERSARGEKGE